jgi:hypothetical protein
MVDDCPGAVVGVDLGAVGKIAVLPKALRGKEGVHRKVHGGKDGAVGVVTGQQQGRRMNPISLLGDDDGCAADDAACGAGGVGVGAADQPAGVPAGVPPGVVRSARVHVGAAGGDQRGVGQEGVGAPTIHEQYAAALIKNGVVFTDTGSQRELAKMVQLLDEDTNLCMSGDPGTGKTKVINRICFPVLTAKYGVGGWWSTAMTGAAAQLLRQGSTIHSVSGIGRGQGLPGDLWRNMSPKAATRWGAGPPEVRCVLVDEAGMASGEFLDNLVQVGRIAKGVAGLRDVRYILVVDFMQLPPVNDMMKL